jgi:hypothetical protein
VSGTAAAEPPDGDSGENGDATAARVGDATPDAAADDDDDDDAAGVDVDVSAPVASATATPADTTGRQ